MDALDRYDALGLADLVRRGEADPAMLLDRAISRTEAVNGQISQNTPDSRRRRAIN